MLCVLSRSQRLGAPQACCQLLPLPLESPSPEGVGQRILTGVRIALGNEWH